MSQDKQHQNQCIKVFVGCDPNNCDLEQMMVLDYSINKHTSMPVDIVWMQLSADRDSFWYSNPATGEGWNTTKWATPFSGFRWAVNEYCNFEGRAIYMDTDVIVLADLKDLWQHPIDNKAVVAAKTDYDITRLCTCVWDCAKARAVMMPIDELRADAKAHHKMMTVFGQHSDLIHPYNDSYNCIDGEGLAVEDIKILHYSDMGTQFSHGYALPRLTAEGSTHWFDCDIIAHPRQDLSAVFDRYYHEALQAGYRLDNYRIEPFGRFPKQSQKGYRGNRVTRAH